MNKLTSLLKESKVEKDVESTYKNLMIKHFPTAKITSPYNTDGFLENGVTMLMEFKFKKDLTKRMELSKIMTQLLFELKRFEEHGDDLPNVVFGGDVDRCFCLHTNAISPYLEEDVDWSIAPSSAADKNPELIKKICEDLRINPYIFNINNKDFKFEEVVDAIKKVNNNETRKIKITKQNINRYFLNFVNNVVKMPNKYNVNELVSIFLGCITDKSNNYLHPKKDNVLVTSIEGNQSNVLINRNSFLAFFDHFDSNYTIEEKKHLTAICDRLIADETRRYHGEFYTPTQWVNEAHKLIENKLGDNWKNEFVVWDPAWGTGNLTRDFKFKELYCSTLNHGDLDMGSSYNPEAVKFQYDFLNDDVAHQGILPIDEIKKLPNGLKKTFENNKPIVFFMNPPFGKATPINGQPNVDATNTSVNNLMVQNKLGIASSQLYLQFLYRIINMNLNAKICLFSPLMFLTGGSNEKFREVFFRNFKFVSGFQFNARHFNFTKNSWGVGFSIWERGVEDKKEINFVVKDFNEDNKIVSIFNKKIYSVSKEESLSHWYNSSILGERNIEYPNSNGGLNVVDTNNKLTHDSIGSINNHANNQMQQLRVFVSSMAISANGFKPIEKNNFLKAVSLFATRKLIRQDWVNQKDEYFAPNTEHPDYKQWNIDAIIYSLFNGSSNQTSLRKIIYNEKEYNVKNEWFWMSNSEMIDLANNENFEELYYDANGDHERFVFNKIQEYKDQFSEDALAVLNKARELVEKSFSFRKILHKDYPEFHLNTWDAGWYQIRKILNLQFKSELVDFVNLYKDFDQRMQEGVYKFGFLK